MILIITSKRDGHIDKVGDYLDVARVPWFRINTEDFAENITLTIEPASGTGSMLVHDSSRCFDLQSIDAVWYRKPDPLDLSHFDLDRASLDYVEAEFNEVIQGLYALLNRAFWINNPLTSKLAHRKPLQLKVAHNLGFSTPHSVITNNLEQVLKFAESVNWDMAVKSLGAVCVNSQQDDVQLHYGIFTRRIGKEELLALQDKISYMPTLFQQYVEKEYELRVTCVGEKIFACRIYSQDKEQTSEDMRFDVSNLRHEMCECPEITDKLIGYLQAFGLNFGCFDIAFSKTGEYVFFECNPNGQWLWIEELTGAPISKAVADILMANSRIKSQCNELRKEALTC